MFNIVFNDFLISTQLFYAFLASKAGFGMTIMVWHQLNYSNGLLRFCRIKRVLPFLTLELRLRLNSRYWINPLSQFLVLALHKCRNFRPQILSGKFLLCRDGRHIFDFFKTLSLNDVSPPLFA